MDNQTLNAIKQNNVLIRLVVSILTTVALFLTRNNNITSLSNGNSYGANVVIYGAFFGLFFGGLKYISFWENNKINSIFHWIMTIFLSFFLIFGFVVRTNEHFEILKVAIVLIGYLFLIYTITWLFTELFLNNWFLQISKQRERNRREPWSLIRIWVIVTIVWCPYFFIYFPGVGPYDFSCQLANFFGFPDLYYNFTSSYLQTGNYLNDHMPIATTIIAGLFAKIGMNHGNVTLGVGLYSFVQMVLTSLVFATVLHKIGKINRRVFYALTIFIAVNPFFPMWSISLAKNTLLGILTICYMLLILEYVRKPEILNNISWDIKIILTAIVLVFVVKYGFLITILTSIFMLMIRFKNLKKMLLILVVPILLVNFAYKDIVIPYFQITPGDPVEALSIPIQQVARTVKYHPENISKHDEKVIDRVFIYNRIGKTYNPELADPIKFSILKKKTVTRKNLRDFLMIWLKLMPRNFKTYVSAYLHLIFGYVDINYDSWNFYPGFDTNISLSNLTDGEYTLQNLKNTSTSRTYVNKLFAKAFSVAPLSLIIRPVVYVWFAIIAFMYLVKRKKYKFIVVLLPLITQFGICLLSPVNGNPRYMLSFPFSLLVIVYTLYISYDDNSEYDKFLK